MEEKQRKSKTLYSRDPFSGRLPINGYICYVVLEVKAVHDSEQQEFNAWTVCTCTRFFLSF